MTTAHVYDTVNDPTLLIKMVVSTRRRLHADLGVTVAIDNLAPSTIANWSWANRTITLRATASIQEQHHCLQSLLNLLAVGPHAAAGAVRVAPRLRLVPSPPATQD